MKKLLLMASAILMAFVMTGCYEQVPAGTVGKIMGKNGWEPEIYPPSKVWVSNNFWNFNPEKLYLVQTTTKKYVQPITVLLNDKMTLRVTIVFRGRITSNKKILNSLFNDMEMNDNIITTDEVYHIYGKMIILNTAREVISKYTVDTVNKNYQRITNELYLALAPKLKSLPIEISDITIGSIEYPDVVTKAIDAAKERQMAIAKEEANVQIALTKAKGAEAVAKANYKIKMLEAKRIRDYNKMIAEGVTPALLNLRKLEIQEKMIDAINNNKNVVYMPMDMMNGVFHMRTLK